MRPKKVVLVVDDDEQALGVRRFLLETRGYRVMSAPNGQYALEVLERIVPGTLDLLLTDLLMPGMDGNELARRAKGMHPGLPVLIVSGTVTALDRELAADGFLPKGAGSASELIESVRKMCVCRRGPKKREPVSVLPEAVACVGVA